MARCGSEDGNTRSSPSGRISASLYWFCTYNNYDDDGVARLIAKADEVCSMYVFEKEVGESGTPHIQGKIKFTKKGRPMETFDNKNIHWEKSKTWKGAEYCTKEGSELGVDIWVKGWDPILPPKMYGWQLDVLDKIPSMEKRKIYWYWEEDGSFSKTDFCRYMVLRENALVVGGKANDMKCAIAAMKVKPKIVIINIPRSNMGFVSYNGIEQISDGLFFSGKYESGMVIFNKPKILVFANEKPNYDGMSMDRWVVKKLR